MTLQFVVEAMKRSGNSPAVALGADLIAYDELLHKLGLAQTWLSGAGIPPGAVVAVKGDYSAAAIALFLALTENRNIVIPMSSDSAVHHDSFSEIGETEYEVVPVGSDFRFHATGRRAGHALYETLRQRGAPGLVLFSSGSTGKSKGVVHDLSLLLNRYRVPRRTFRTITFLQFDHIGGINTLLYTLANGGVAIIPESRKPAAVCRAIETHRAEILPTSPTFLNLLLLSGEYEKHDLSSLELITYGTEPMPESTLSEVSRRFPKVRLQQTYGLSEVGILRSKSRDDSSLWVKIGGEEFKTKIIGNRLWIKSESAMLGYLNAESPFDDEGYFDTGDMVEQDGEWLKILGRESELINVGGEKVYPAEVESVLLEMDNVEDVTVSGEKHPITGMIVAAEVKIETPEPLPEFKIRMRSFCAGRLQPFKIPTRVRLTDAILHNERFKKKRMKSNSQ